MCHIQESQDDGEVASQLVHLVVVPRTSLAILPAQDYYEAEEGTEVLLVVRTNLEFSVCKVSKDMMKLEVEFSARKEICEDKICLGVIQTIPSCVLTIQEVSSDTRGQWTFQISAHSQHSCNQHDCEDNLLTESTQVMLYSPEEVEMMGTSTTEMTTEMTTMDTTTTMGPINYVIDKRAKMRLRPLLQSCLNMGSGLLQLADKEDLVHFIESVNCTL